jgi:hypothetical protein
MEGGEDRSPALAPLRERRFGELEVGQALCVCAELLPHCVTLTARDDEHEGKADYRSVNCPRPENEHEEGDDGNDRHAG